MKLAIDITYTPSGGSLSQIVNMLKYFNRDPSVQLVIYTKKSNLDLLNNIVNAETKIIVSWLADISVPTRIIWEQVYLPIYLLVNKPDLLFSPGNIAPYFSPVKNVLWIGTIGPFWKPMYKLDLSFLLKIKYRINKYLMYKTAQKSTIVIFESRYTKNLFNINYNVSEKKSLVINIGKDNFFLQRSNSNYLKPFILCVSHIYPYKNIINLIIALSKSIGFKNDYKLLIAGKIVSKKYYTEIYNMIKIYDLEEKVEFLGNVSKETLRQLYYNCEFMVFPSPVENFAYTLVEAMSCGCAVLCSNTTAMPETCGNSALYFNPANIDDIAQKIDTLISDSKLLLKLKKKSQQRAKMLPDYKKVTQLTFRIMKKVK